MPNTDEPARVDDNVPPPEPVASNTHYPQRGREQIDVADVRRLLPFCDPLVVAAVLQVDLIGEDPGQPALIRDQPASGR